MEQAKPQTNLFSLTFSFVRIISLMLAVLLVMGFLSILIPGLGGALLGVFIFAWLWIPSILFGILSIIFALVAKQRKDARSYASEIRWGLILGIGLLVFGFLGLSFGRDIARVFEI